MQIFGDCSGPSHDSHYIKPGEVSIEGELLKQGKRYDMWVKRYFVLKDSTLLCYKDNTTRIPKSK